MGRILLAAASFTALIVPPTAPATPSFWQAPMSAVDVVDAVRAGKVKGLAMRLRDRVAMQLLDEQGRLADAVSVLDLGAPRETDWVVIELLWGHDREINLIGEWFRLARYLVFDASGPAMPRFVGAVSCSTPLARFSPPSPSVEQLNRRDQLLVLQVGGGLGTGLACYQELWFSLRRPKRQPLVLVTDARDANTQVWVRSGTERRRLVATERGIELHVDAWKELHRPGDDAGNIIDEKRGTVVFVQDEATGRFELDERRSAFTAEEWADFAWGREIR